VQRKLQGGCDSAHTHRSKLLSADRRVQTWLSFLLDRDI
jgi:hypothetical protein